MTRLSDIKPWNNIASDRKCPISILSRRRRMRLRVSLRLCSVFTFRTQCAFVPPQPFKIKPWSKNNNSHWAAETKGDSHLIWADIKEDHLYFSDVLLFRKTYPNTEEQSRAKWIEYSKICLLSFLFFIFSPTRKTWASEILAWRDFAVLWSFYLNIAGEIVFQLKCDKIFTFPFKLLLHVFKPKTVISEHLH